MNIKEETQASNDLEEVKNAFTAIASHNLRTPLATIRGYFQLMDTETNQKIKENYLSLIKTNIDILSNITEEVLGILTLGTNVEKTTINVENVIKEIIESFKKETINRKIDIVIKKLSDIPITNPSINTDS